MIKKLLFTFFVFTTLFSFSQFSLTVEGTVINNNDVITVNTIDSSAEREFIITNLNTTMPINTLVEVESITNSDGSHLTLCYNECYYGIVEGNSYPETGPVVLAPNSQSAPHGNHFLNEGVGDDPNAPITYILKFYEVDGSGNEIGTPIRLSYAYNPYAVAIEDLNQISYNLYPTVTESTISVIVNETVSLKFYNTQGKLVKQLEINKGNNTIDVSSLAKQIYYIVLSNQNKQQSLSKIIIK